MHKLARNWDLAVTSSALAVIVGCLVAPRLRRGRASEATRPV